MDDEQFDLDAFLHDGPIILSPEGLRRVKEIMAQPAKPLPEEPLPIEGL